MSCSDGHGGTEAGAARGLPQLLLEGRLTTLAGRHSPARVFDTQCRTRSKSGHQGEAPPTARSAAFLLPWLLSHHERLERGRREAHDQHDETKHGDYKPVGIDTDVVVERWRVMRSHDEQHHEHQHGPYQPTH